MAYNKKTINNKVETIIKYPYISLDKSFIAILKGPSILADYPARKKVPNLEFQETFKYIQKQQTTISIPVYIIAILITEAL